MGNSWRTTDDIQADWNSVLECLDNTVDLARFAGPGAWNDPDMLEVGLSCNLGFARFSKGFRADIREASWPCK